MIRILVVDHHHLFRDGLVHVLNDAPELLVVANACDGDAALQQALETRPDIGIIGLEMPGLDELELIRRLGDNLPLTRLIILTTSNRPDDLFAALRAGAHSYLLKSITSQELVSAIRETHTGRRVVDCQLLPSLIDEFVRLQTRLGDPDPGGHTLTARERQVLEAVANGQSNPQIGASLGLSPHTVKAHLRSILEKLGFHSRAEAAAWAARHLH